jgi:hypothetical protein
MLKVLALFSLLSQTLLPPLSAAAPTEAARVMPQEVKAVYVTSNMVRHPQFSHIKKLLRETELNAVVINTKEPWGPRLDKKLAQTIKELHDDGLWVIARQVTFQDDQLATTQPELALKKPNGQLWRDNGGRTWVDPASQKVWQHNLAIAKLTLDYGFDEINLDYVRFPTDGNTKAIVYPAWDKIRPREDVITDFASWFRRQLKAYKPQVIVSADVFAYTFVEDWDLDMGQRVKKLASAVDVLAPMVYPSHYYGKNFGFTNPAEHPYEVVKLTLDKGRKLLTDNPQIIVRPWLQDFNMGAIYDAAKIKAQIKGVKDAGYNAGWMLWDPRNIYTSSALEPKLKITNN